jgi:ketosteroid isomerase-like protein
MAAPAQPEAPDPLAVVLRAVELFNGKELDAFYAMLTEDVEWIPDPAWPDAEPMRGVGELRAFTDRFRDAWASVSLEIDEVVRSENPLVGRAHWAVTGRTSGAESRVDFSVVVYVRGERISGARFYFDHSEALRAPGLAG